MLFFEIHKVFMYAFSAFPHLASLAAPFIFCSARTQDALSTRRRFTPELVENPPRRLPRLWGLFEALSTTVAIFDKSNP